MKGDEYKVRHPRLHAFYESKFINMMMVATVVSLYMLADTGDLVATCACAGVSFLAGLCYSVWLWVKKPDRIVVNSWLSGLSTVLTLGFLVIGVGWNFAGSGLVALLFGIGAVAVSASGFGDRVYLISERRYE